MTLDDFKIGTLFDCSEKRYLCTDIGTRTVVAIRIDRIEKSTHNSDGTVSHEILNFEVAQSEGWFSGPPYAVSEIVFDEDDLKACKPIMGA
jgi:hypothetical protein